MSFRLTITSQARGDIDRNADWWAGHHSLEQALSWSDAVYDQLETLRDFAESHALSLENESFLFEIRDKLVGLGSRRRYRAVFTIRNDEVVVLMVRAAEESGITSDDVDDQQI